MDYLSYENAFIFAEKQIIDDFFIYFTDNKINVSKMSENMLLVIEEEHNRRIVIKRIRESFDNNVDFYLMCNEDCTKAEFILLNYDYDAYNHMVYIHT